MKRLTHFGHGCGALILLSSFILSEAESISKESLRRKERSILHPNQNSTEHHIFTRLQATPQTVQESLAEDYDTLQPLELELLEGELRDDQAGPGEMVNILNTAPDPVLSRYTFDKKQVRRMLQLRKFRNYQESYRHRRRLRWGQQRRKKVSNVLNNKHVDESKENTRKRSTHSKQRLPKLYKRKKKLRQRKFHQAQSNRPLQRPNIILIVADDLGYNDVPWHNPDVRAPNLLKLARKGVILENHYVLPLCTPSRAALLTGIYPFRYGKQAGEALPLSPTGLNTSLTLLPERLKQLGYSTHLIGKWHLGYCSWDYTPTRRGFDSFYGFYLGSQTYYTQFKKLGHRKGSLSWSSINEVDSDYDYSGRVSNGSDADESLKTSFLRGPRKLNKKFQKTGGRDFRLNELPLSNVTGIYSNELYARRAEDLILEHAAKGTDDSRPPLFMMLSTQAVHGPVEVPLKYRKRYTATTKNLARRTLLGMVDALDDVVGRVVEQLKDSGLYENSIILFTTDNGGNIHAGGNNFPLRGCKGGLFEGGTKGVAFVHSPLLPKTGYKYNGMMHIVDLHETILHVAQNGTAVPRGPGWRKAISRGRRSSVPDASTSERDGLILWHSIVTNTQSPRNSFVYNVRKKPLRGAIRRRNWKLIVGKGGKYDGWILPTDVSAGSQGNLGQERCCSSWHSRMPQIPITLYNLKDDPLETTDVSYLHPDITATMKALLRKYAREGRRPYMPKEDPMGHPSLHGGFFSPGWCEAIA